MCKEILVPVYDLEEIRNKVIFKPVSEKFARDRLRDCAQGLRDRVCVDKYLFKAVQT